MTGDAAQASDFLRAAEIFNRLRRAAPEAQQALLDEACSGDPALRAAVEGLWQRHAEITAHEASQPGDRPETLARLIDASIGARPSASRVPERIGAYRIVRPLGVGGMGHVYEAEQDEPRRAVAIKILRDEVATPDVRARFRREGELLARLSHEAIARIHAVGEDGGVPFLVMELVEGEPIDTYARSLDTEARIELLARVGEGVAHAHRNGIIHRDLKPSNILVTADGQPKILDFGVARPTEATQHTAVGQVIGTLAYMSPEQLRGQSEDVDTRSDVFALGVLGYEVLCGHRPYREHEANPALLLKAMFEREAPTLARTDRTLGGDLSVVVGKALALDAERRYGTADAFVEDLRRTLRNEPILARPPTRLYQIQKFVSRNKALVTGSAVAVLALVVSLIVALVMRADAEQARDDAARDARIARAAESRAAMTAASIASNSDTPWLAADHLDQVDASARDWAWSHLRAAQEPWLSELALAPGIEAVAVDEHGRLRACPLPETPLAADVPWNDASLGGPTLCDAGGKLTQPAPVLQEGKPRYLRVPGGMMLYTVHGLASVVEFGRDAQGGLVKLRSYAGPAGVGPLAVSGDRGWIAHGDTAGVIHIWRHGDEGAQAPARTLRTQGGPIGQLAWHPDGRHLALGTSRGGVRVLEIATGRTVAWGRVDTEVVGLAFDRTGRHVVAASREHVRVFPVVRTNVTVLRHHGMGEHENQGPYIYGLALGPQARFVLSGGWDGTVRVADTRTGRLRVTVSGFRTIRALAYAPQREMLAVCATETSYGAARSEIVVWHLPTARRLYSAPSRSVVNHMTFSPDGSRLFTLVSDVGHGLLDTSTWKPVWQTEHRAHHLAPQEARFDGPDRLLMVASDREPARRLDVRTGRVLERIGEPLEDWPGLAVDGKGRVAISGRRDHRVDVRGPQPDAISTFDAGATVHTMSFGPQGRLFVGGTDNRIGIWDAARGARVHTLVGHENYVFCGAWAEDQRLLATAGGDGSVRLWHTRPARERRAERLRIEALEEKLHPTADRLFAETGDVVEARARVAADASHDAEARAVLLDRLMELAWQAKSR